MIFVLNFLFYFLLFFLCRRQRQNAHTLEKKRKGKKATESPEDVFICGHRLDSDLESILYLVCVSEVVPTTSS